MAHVCQLGYGRLSSSCAPVAPNLIKEESRRIGVGHSRLAITIVMAISSGHHHLSVPLGYKSDPDDLPSLLPPPTCIPVVKTTAAKPRLRCSKSTPSDVLRLMDTLRISVSPDLYSSLLLECTRSRSLLDGAEVHAHINRTSFEPGIMLGNRLVAMYLACGCFHDALQVFDVMRNRDAVSWAAIVMGYVESNRCQEALELFIHTHEQDMMLHELIIFSVLQACGSMTNYGFKLVQQIHGLVLKMGMANDPLIATELFQLYRKEGSLDEQFRLFYRAVQRDAVPWTGIISSYNQQKQFSEAIRAFNAMRMAGRKANHFIFSSVLHSCARVGDRQMGMRVHAGSLKARLDENVFVGTSIISMYGKLGLLEEARRVFDAVADKNVVCWNAMLGAYIQNSDHRQAHKLLYEMKARRVKPHKALIDKLIILSGDSES